MNTDMHGGRTIAGNTEYDGGRGGSRDIMKKLNMHTRISVIIIAIGLVLMMRQMYADSEPGAIPLLLVVLGIGWYFITRARIRSHHK